MKEIPIKSDDFVGRAVLTELVDPESSKEVILGEKSKID